MELNCGLKCLKYLLFVFNLIICLVGIAAVVVGIISLVQESILINLLKFTFDQSTLVQSSSIVVIVAGSFIFLVGFMGCCGAHKESTCMLGIYGVIVLVIIIIEIVGIALAAAFQGKVTDELKGNLKKLIMNDYDGKAGAKDTFSFFIDATQVQFSCCGVDSYTEYAGATKWNKTHPGGNDNVVPLSCCKLKDKADYPENPSKAVATEATCQQIPTTGNSNIGMSCYNSIKDFADQNTKNIIIVSVVVLIVEVVCFVIALCLCLRLRKEGS